MIGADIEVFVKRLTEKLAQLTVQPTLRRHICDTQEKDPYLSKVLQQLEVDHLEGFSMYTDKGLLWRWRLYVLKDERLIKELLIEVHDSSFTLHPGNTKMYPDLRSYY